MAENRTYLSMGQVEIRQHRATGEVVLVKMASGTYK